MDGKVVQVRALGDASRCPVNGSDFVHRQPCPAKAEVEFETPPLAPGAHTLRARVFDAAGNAATGAGPLKIDVPGPIDPDPINSTATTPAPATSRAKPTRRVQLRALRQRIKPYGRMLLSGRIRAGRLQRGALVEIQLRSGRGWRTIAVRRTNSTGMFRFRYRFRRTAHARLAFRARVRPDNELPVKPLPSRTVRVRVGRG